ncbi:hypothetical protein KC973_00630 [Candidatus Saccharibacteria bacterium]|nr:hypothetical protein [Candidatus Saccharibacteria bacterium]
MIEINLLPQVKKDYLKAEQMKHTVIVASVLLSVVALVIVGLLFAYVSVVQPQHQKNVQGDIDSGLSDLKGKDNAVKIVTVQGALETLPGLEDKQLATSRLFVYVAGFTPRSVLFSNIKLDVTESTLTLQGTAATFEQANVLANNLKGAKFTYVQNESEESVQPFSNVVFDGLSRSEQAEDTKNVSFQITLTFDPIIFNQSVEAGKLQVNASSEDLLLQDEKPFIDGGGQ